VCGNVRKLHDKNGKVHLHGPRNDRCLGSNQLPAAYGSQLDPSSQGGPSLDQGSVLPDSVASGKDIGSLTRNCLHPVPKGRILKHIPKAARPSVSRLLATIINRILADPTSVHQWQCLLSFAAVVLEQPMRGGRRHNLTATIKKRAESYFNDWPDKGALVFDQQLHSHRPPVRCSDEGETARAAAVSAKLEEGNITAAVRILCSDDKPAPINAETLAELEMKHPTPPEGLQLPLPPPTAAYLQVTEIEVAKRVRTFPTASAGGPDGLRPQHILELCNCAEAGPELITAITALVNSLLAGVCPDGLRSILFGGTLFALRKKGGGLRPIVIGYYWRRLVSKCANAFALTRITDHLSPRQVGVGIRGGCEAAVHSGRRFLQFAQQDSVLVKLDFENAFNSMRRDQMLLALYDALPELASYCHLAYGEASVLKFGNFSLLSQMGPQQGDPLGPLLFCLPLQPVLMKLASDMTLGYMDDLSLGGEESVVAADVEFVEREAEKLGLHLNHAKCEAISSDNRVLQYDGFKKFKHVKPEAATLLGAPLSGSGALDHTLESHCRNLSSAITRLSSIGRHDALILLRCSLSHPKLLHTLRCFPCVDHPKLKEFDSLLRTGLEVILNLSLSDNQWAQASLPVKVGGLGIRRVTSLAFPAFLASAAGTRVLQSAMLGRLHVPDDAQYGILRERWCAEYAIPCPDDSASHRQSSWDKPMLDRDADNVASSVTDDYNRARLKAVGAPHASDWLFALPIAACGLRLDDEAVRVAVGLRLGVNICEPHECRCGSMVKANGAHGLCCSLGPGRVARHASLNDLICRGLIRAGIPAVKEPPGLSRADGKRPDGLTLIPWLRGRALIWDATVVDSLASSYLPSTSARGAAAAELAADRKLAKYNVLAQSYHFVPVAFETLGPINSSGHVFIAELGRCLARTTGDTRETSYLYQRFSITIQRFNAVAFYGSFKQQDLDES